jgi:hypothetical protein
MGFTITATEIMAFLASKGYLIAGFTPQDVMKWRSE